MVRDESRLRRDRWPVVGGFRYIVRDDRWEWIPFTCRHRIIDTRRKEHLVLVVGDSFRDNGGGLAGITGFYIDITEQFNNDLQERLSEAVQTISERRAVINQAIGMLMLRYGKRRCGVKAVDQAVSGIEHQATDHRRTRRRRPRRPWRAGRQPG